MSSRGRPRSAPAFSPDGAYLAAGDTKGMVRVYDGRTGQEAFTLKELAGVGPPVFSPDGTRIMTTLRGVVRVCEVRAGQKPFALKGQSRVLAPVFSPDGARIAAADALDRMIVVYDVQTGQEVFTLKGPWHVQFPLFSPDGARLAAWRTEGVVRLWTAPQASAAWQAERRQALVDTLLTWHQSRAKESEQTGEWYAAAFHLARLIEAEPDSGLHHYHRGMALAHLARAAEADKEFEKALLWKNDLPEFAQADAHAQLARWEAAARLYAKITKGRNTPPYIIWYRHALLCLHLGDRAGYSRACATMLGRFGRIKNPAVANQVAWACALAPDALSGLEPAVDLARMAVQSNPKEWAMRNTLGAILYRAGLEKEAIKELNEAIRLNPAGATAIDFLFLAMAHHRLGKVADAKSWLAKARQAQEKQPPVFWTDRMEWQLLHREAETLLKTPPPDPKK